MNIGVIIRFVLAVIVGILVQRDIITAPSAEDIDKLAAGIAGVLTTIALAWSFYQKKRADITVATALDMPQLSTRRELAREVKSVPSGGGLWPALDWIGKVVAALRKPKA